MVHLIVVYYILEVSTVTGQDHSWETVLYSGLPGGVSTVKVMALPSRAYLRVIDIVHAVCILVLLVAIPPVLQFIGHVDIGSATPALSQ